MFPFTNGVVLGIKLPPVAASYHLIEFPVTTKSAIVADEQKNWVDDPVGATTAGSIEIVIVAVEPH